MFGRKSPDVFVVGAGPVGMFAALLLARRGLSVKIIDTGERKAGHSYALGLHPATLRLLKGAGLLEEILQNSYKVAALGLYDKETRRTELRMLPADDGLSFLAVTPQNRLERILEDALNKTGVSVLWSHRLTGLEESAGGVRVHFERLEKESLGYAVAHTEWVVGKTMTADVPFVIGADGYASRVRRLLGIDFDLVGETQIYAVYEFETGADFHHESCLVLDENTTDVLWPLGNGRCRWSFQMTDVTTSEESRTKERLEVYLGSGRFPWLSDAYLHNLIRERAPWFRDRMEEIDWGIVVRFERRLARSFGRGRVWLAGDSAHLTGPVGVQSLNAGLREAFDLAAGLADALGGDSHDLAAEYGAKQICEWNVLHGTAGGLRGGPETDPWIAHYRDRLLSCLPGTGPDLPLLARQLNLEPAQECCAR